MGTVRSGLPSFQDQGYLVWDPDGKVGGISDSAELVQQATEHVKAAGEHGCGFEAPLEAMYRFLVDPEPPEAVDAGERLLRLRRVPTKRCSSNARHSCDRARRSASCCSRTRTTARFAIPARAWKVKAGWSSTSSVGMPRATSVCSTNPDDPLLSFLRRRQPARVHARRPRTRNARRATTTSTLEDPLNLRCWDQKRRFGVDWLYPVKRYIDGLTHSQIENRAGQLVANPLLAARAPGQIVVTGIVGVPWQDVATVESLSPGRPTLARQ